MHAYVAFLAEARDLIRPLWSRTGERMATQAIKWLYSEDGAWAYTRFAAWMFDAKVVAQTDPVLGDRLLGLVRAVFQLEVEVAARRQGVCPELEAVPFDDVERAYRRVADQESC